jgi:peptidylprolyl isomerase
MNVANVLRMLNSKSEALNSKQIPNPKLQCFKQVSLQFGKLGFRNCLGFRISDFGFRIIIFLLFCLISFRQLYAEEKIIKVEAVGEAFGQPVTKEEFLYYYKTASIFTRSGDKEKKEGERSNEERRQEAWQNLIFNREAKSLGINVDKEELQEELKRLVAEKEVQYGTEKYAVWVSSTFGEDVKTFEQRIEDLLRINKLMKLKMDPEVTVTEDQMKEKFLNEYNSFESEYILFTNEQEAKDFAQKCKKNPRLWYDTYQEKKPLGQKGASWINIMSLEALIDLWKIPKEDAYRILESNEGDFIAAKNYYGDVVFRLLFKRKADLKEYDEKKQEYYRKMLTQSKKYKLAKDYFDDLIKRANYRDYVAEKQQAEKIEALKKKSQVVLETNQGDIELKLFPDIAPLACENFIGLIEKGYYNGIIFHRVIKDFMIQGGDPTGTGTGGESFWGDKPFADEISDKLQFDKPGVLAMANSGPDTNKSQFFITVKPTPHLNKKHTIFGEVVSGMDVVKKIEEAPTCENDKPKEEQKIIKAYIKKIEQEKKK